MASFNVALKQMTEMPQQKYSKTCQWKKNWSGACRKVHTDA